jgi:hypothetical protein
LDKRINTQDLHFLPKTKIYTYDSGIKKFAYFHLQWYSFETGKKFYYGEQDGAVGIETLGGPVDNVPQTLRGTVSPAFTADCIFPHVPLCAYGEHSDCV